MLDKFIKYKKWFDKILIFGFIVFFLDKFRYLEYYCSYVWLNGCIEEQQMCNRCLEYIDKSVTHIFSIILFFSAYWIFIGFKSKTDH